MGQNDLDKLSNVQIDERKPMSDDELKKRLGGLPFASGDTVHLSKIDYALKKLMIGVGWDIPGIDNNGIDVDFSIFLLDKNDQTREDSDFIFYNNLTGENGAVEHLGDNRTGAGDGDDERVLIDLNALPFDILKIIFVISIYDAEMRDQNITALKNLFIRLVNVDTEIELLRFPIKELSENKLSSALVAGELVREGPTWLFTARGDVTSESLGKIATQHGIMVTG